MFRNRPMIARGGGVLVTRRNALVGLGAAAAALWLPPSAGQVISPSGGIVLVEGGDVFTVFNGGAPQLLYTDILAGPTSNGENNLGAYLWIFGRNLGALSDFTGGRSTCTIGGHAVANFRALVPAATNVSGAHPDLYALGVQVGALGGLAAGSSGAIVITTPYGTSNNNLTFTNQPGHFYFVDETNGNDATAVVDDITHPWQHLQVCDSSNNITSTGATTLSTAAGSTFVLRVGTWTYQNGKDYNWCRIWGFTGTAPNGSANNGYIHFTAYPGLIGANAPEAVNKTVPATAFYGNGSNGGIAGADSAQDLAGNGKYWTVSNLDIQCNPSATDGPVDLQAGGNYVRVVNNNLGPWMGTVYAKAAGIAGQGVGTSSLPVFLQGNYIHDIASPTDEAHGIYAGGANVCSAYWDCGFNHIYNMQGGSGIQSFNSQAPSGAIGQMQWHDNYIDTTLKFGLNAADDSSGPFYMWNNVVVNTGLSAFRCNPTANQTIYCWNNTFYNNWNYNGGAKAIVSNDYGGSTNITLGVFANNILVMASGHISGLTWEDLSGATVTWSNCLFYDFAGTVTTGFPGGTGMVTNVNPQWNTDFTNFGLQASSPAIGAGTASLPLSTLKDFLGNPQPRAGQTNPSIGAHA